METGPKNYDELSVRGPNYTFPNTESLRPADQALDSVMLVIWQHEKPDYQNTAVHVHQEPSKARVSLVL